jgi:hypothetical protein
MSLHDEANVTNGGARKTEEKDGCETLTPCAALKGGHRG